MKVLLNLGCGAKPLSSPKRGWVVINHDLWKHSDFVDETWDLDLLPWPWADGTIHQVYAHSILEHLEQNLLVSMNECWRILKPNGKIDLKLPLWSKDVSHDDPTHRWFVGTHGLDIYDPTTRRGADYGSLYGIRPWRIVKQVTSPEAHCLRGVLEKVG